MSKPRPHVARTWAQLALAGLVWLASDLADSRISGCKKPTNVAKFTRGRMKRRLVVATAQASRGYACDFARSKVKSGDRGCRESARGRGDGAASKHFGYEPDDLALNGRIGEPAQAHTYDRDRATGSSAGSSTERPAAD